jgi:hypothetical protein
MTPSAVEQFEADVFATVEQIFGPNAPRRQALRNPKVRGPHFDGLSYDQRERLMTHRPMNDALRVGLWLLAYFHWDRSYGTFKGLFSKYVRTNLHEAYDWNEIGTTAVAEIYGASIAEVAKLSEMVATSYPTKRQSWMRLQEDIDKAIRLNSTDRLIAHYDRQVKMGGDYVRCKFR